MNTYTVSFSEFHLQKKQTKQNNKQTNKKTNGDTIICKYRRIYSLLFLPLAKEPQSSWDDYKYTQL